MMIFHYLKLARKALIKYKYYTSINVFGLVCGMLSVLIIAKYIGGTLQFDSYHLKKDQIYFVTQEEFVGGSAQQRRSSTYLGVADQLLQFAEVETFTKYYQRVESLIIAHGVNDGDEVSFTENKIFVADSSFFKIFTFAFKHGDERTALSTPNSIVVTKSAAEKYFGDINPIGKTLTVRVSWGDEANYEVTGVLQDIPKLSRFKFDFLIVGSGQPEDERWTVPDYSVFMLLKENANAAALATKLTGVLADIPELKTTNRRINVTLDALASVQLSSTEYLLITVGMFIILISWFNYINQVIAQSYWRIREIGVLRVMGASEKNLKVQFIVESGLMCFVCYILVIVMYWILERLLQSLTDGHLLPLFGDPTFINVMFFGIFVVGVITAATIQTLVLLPKNFGQTIQNVYSTKIGSIGLRKVLVVIQFSISTVLMIGIFVISNQLEYMRTKEKGINMNNILVVKAPMVKDTTWNVKRKTLELFKQRCAELPFVTDVTSSTTVPGEAYRQETFLSLDDRNNKVLIHQNGVDEYFFSLYGVKFIAGQDFIPDARAKNRTSIILNRSAARALGISEYDKAINAKIFDYEEEEEQEYDLVGIVEDYHQTSLRNEVRPMAFKFNVLRGHCSLKVDMTRLSGEKLSEGLMALQAIWKESYPDASFDFFFLDDRFLAQDQQDRYFGKLFSYFTILSLVISCLGLFGLSLLISTKRQKEIGVRKVFGASTNDILSIFLKSYVWPLAISLVMGIPVAFFMMNVWLRNYAYRIDIGVGIVALAVGSLVVIFLFTVSYYTLRSATTNPVKVLRE